jgi:alkylhydroperoxidase family enzyme
MADKVNLQRGLEQLDEATAKVPLGLRVRREEGHALAGDGATPADRVVDRPSSFEDTLVPLLRDQMVPWETLEKRHRAMLELVRLLLGVVPNCDQYLEIWPPAFRTYNVMVPNLLNLPFSVLGIGGAPAGVVGMSMYVASRVAECPYCSAHTCSFALRRGASPEKMAQALVTEDAGFSRGELATIAVARSLARIPCELTAAERDELRNVYGAKRAEWIVLGATMMGFLNKFMDAIGVELEQAVVAEVRTTMGRDWSPGKAGAALDPRAATKPPPPADGLLTKVRIVPLLPAALRTDARWQRGVPGAWPAVGDFLRERTGHDFPVLSRLHHRRAVRSVASMLRENLNPVSTIIGLDIKILAGVVFAEVVADEALAGDVRAMAGKHAVTDVQMDAAARFARREGDAALPHGNPKLRAALTLSRAASPSPARIDADVVATCREGGLSAPAIVELVCWLSVLQMLHRLSCFYARP